MAWYILTYHRQEFENIVIAMANTGKERIETMTFARQCQNIFGQEIILVEALVHHGIRKSSSFRSVSFDNYSQNGEPFEDVIKKYGIPNKAFPHCTRELKTNPLHSYIKSLGWKKYKTAIGIRADEMDRINWKEKAKKNYWYPLADSGKTKKDVEAFWQAQPFTLNLLPHEGNCDFCWKKSLKKLQKIAKENPSLMNWWREMEVKYGNHTPLSRKVANPPYRFGRGNVSVDEIANMPITEDNQMNIEFFDCQETCEPL